MREPRSQRALRETAPVRKDDVQTTKKRTSQEDCFQQEGTAETGPSATQADSGSCAYLQGAHLSPRQGSYCAPSREIQHDR